MTPTLKDVAKLAKVSTATASLALNGKPVNEETKKRVLEAAKKLNYVTSRVGKSLISGKSHTIGLYILNSRTNNVLTEECSFFYSLLRGVLSVTTKYGYLFNFEVGFWEDLKSNNFILEKVYSRSVDGAILIPQYVYHYGFLETLEEKGFPFVVYNPVVQLNPAKSIVIDNYKGACKAAEYLIKNGFKRIGFINGPKNHFDAVNREKGFIDTLIKYGVKIYKEYMINSTFTINGGYDSMKHIINNCANLPDAIFCCNDYMAAGAIRALDQLGYKVPEDISVIGFDDTDIARGLSPALTTLKNPMFEVGKYAAERLFELIEEKDDKLDPIVLTPELIVRDSCAKAKK